MFGWVKAWTKGIGNGISMILFAGIVSGPPCRSDVWKCLKAGYYAQQYQYLVWVPAIIVLFLALIYLIADDQRRASIPIQYSKRVVAGRCMAAEQLYPH